VQGSLAPAGNANEKLFIVKLKAIESSFTEIGRKTEAKLT